MIVQLDKLIEKKEQELGRTITQEELSKATKIPQGTISRWVGNKVDRLDKRVLESFLDYFDCEIGDLLKRDRTG